MSIPKLHLPTEEADFIINPYKTMGEFREETPVFWDEINGLYFFTRYADVRSIQSSKTFGTTFNHIEGFEEDLESSLKAIARAGAGVNNVPVQHCSKNAPRF